MWQSINFNILKLCFLKLSTRWLVIFLNFGFHYYYFNCGQNSKGKYYGMVVICGRHYDF
jgi:hypothetical protein